MKGLIIFDFNRTLYNPDTGSMLEGALSFLEEYSRKYSMALIAKGGDERKKIIDSLNIKRFFSFINIVEEKNKSQFEECIGRFNFSPENTWSIGDRVKKDVRFPKECGIRTIWLKKGKFADEIPADKSEEPEFIAGSFGEIKNIIPL